MAVQNAMPRFSVERLRHIRLCKTNISYGYSLKHIMCHESGVHLRVDNLSLLMSVYPLLRNFYILWLFPFPYLGQLSLIYSARLVRLMLTRLGPSVALQIGVFDYLTTMQHRCIARSSLVYMHCIMVHPLDLSALGSLIAVQYAVVSFTSDQIRVE